ncbi:MAG TPA: hypothetical protein VJZ00_06730 [Thermoanaerobaculia bacterium]|nr:hypothetical protein [Thermoanaerobaculia bacterium]
MDRELAADYYKRIAKFILPHLKRRPISFKRTIEGEAFWEKDAPSFTPRWVKRFPVPRREGGPPIQYIVVDDVRTLVWVASIGGIELHPFLHKVPRIDVATSVVFDLDPGEGAGLRECAKVAKLLRDALPLRSFAKVSGSKGIQVYVPLNDGKTTHDVTETFARLVADELARRHPTLIVSKMAKALRRKKVFIDWSQNADYKTTVGVYSLRETGFVSMPVDWDELESRFTPEEALKRVRKTGDLFAPVEKLKQSLGITLPAKPKVARKPRGTVARAKSSQSGKRLYLITKTETGSELWLDFAGKFRRFLLRPDRERKDALVAMPAGEFAIDRAYYRGEVPKNYEGRVTIEEQGTFEIIDGSFATNAFDLWFNGRVLAGKWTLAKISASPRHRSWRLTPRSGTA